MLSYKVILHHILINLELFSFLMACKNKYYIRSHILQLPSKILMECDMQVLVSSKYSSSTCWAFKETELNVSGVLQRQFTSNLTEPHARVPGTPGGGSTGARTKQTSGPDPALNMTCSQATFLILTSISFQMSILKMDNKWVPHRTAVRISC